MLYSPPPLLMTARATPTPDSAPTRYDEPIANWRRRAPWYRRFSARLGLQGKMVLSFLAVLSMGLGVSCWMFATKSAEQLSDVMGEQVRQLSSALALSGEEDVRTHDLAELRRLAQELIKSRNILFVGFLDADSKPLALASRDLEFGLRNITVAQGSTQSLMQVHQRCSPLFGDYLEVVSPILTTPGITTPGNGPRLLGFVAVGVSLARETAQLQSVNYMIVGIGCLMIVISLPLGYVLVHRVFQPIRELVKATQQIIGGDLDTRVAVHRPDVIGILARSFNEMVIWVKKQQHDLAAANDKLAEANKDLERKIEQRTVQLEAANKRLSSEIAEKEDFLRAVSHDLNAPLRNISGMATMLLMKYRENLDNDVIHRLERIQKNVEIETDLIAELLELSRIKTRRQKMENVEIDAMVRELRDMFENDLRERHIDLLIDSPLPVLNCERARIRQVFQNLIDNAIKYMGDHSGKPHEIHVGCFVRMTEAEFYVRDTGIGIESDELDKVFFVFRRGKNPAVQTVAGKGIGLASVKSIIETYSGSIWVESVVGEGSTFHFTINGKYVPAAHSAPANLTDASNFTARQLETSSAVEEGQ
jgi:signal transduction histidine kinase